MGFPSKGAPKDKRLKENNPNAGKKPASKPAQKGMSKGEPRFSNVTSACLILPSKQHRRMISRLLNGKGKERF